MKSTVFSIAKVAALNEYYKPKKKKRMAKAKVIDPVKARNNLLKTAIKKVVAANTVLPILEHVYFTGKEAVVTDLENAVIVPFQTDGKQVCAPAKMLIDIMEIMDIADLKVDKNFGIEFSGGKRDIKIMGENPDQFPVTAMFNKEESRANQPYPVLGRFSAADMDLLEQAICFVSNDDLRPAMTGVCFEAPDINKQSWMVATDAHRLFFKPMSEMKETFILPAKAAKILLALGGEWDVTSDSMFQVNEDGKIILKQPTKTARQAKPDFEVDGVKYVGDEQKLLAEWKDNEEFYKTFGEFIIGEYGKRLVFDPENENHFEEVEVPDTDKVPEPFKIGPHHICFKRDDGVMVITRIIDARFPDYRVVIPRYEDHVARILSDKEFLLRECKNALKFANRSTHQIVFNLNGSVKVNSQDVDFSFEYNYEFTQGEAQSVFAEGFATLTEEEQVVWHELRTKEDLYKPEWQSWKKMQEKFERLKAFKGIAHDELSIAFNGKFLSEIIHKQPAEEPVTIKIFGPTKAAIINDGYLLMPLMLNQ